MPVPYELKRVTIDDISWTPVTLPWEARKVFIRVDSVAFKIRTDAADPATEDTVAATVQNLIQADFDSAHTFNFRSGAALAYLQSTSGSATAVITYVL